MIKRKQVRERLQEEIATLKAEVKKYQDETTQMGTGLRMSYNKLKEEAQELRQTLTRRTNMGHWFWLVAICYIGSRPFTDEVGTQYGTPSWPPPRTRAVQTVNAGGALLWVVDSR